MTDYMEINRAETVVQLSNDLLKAVVACMKVHGRDPENINIIVAGFAHVIDLINVVNPTFRDDLCSLMSNHTLNDAYDTALRNRFGNFNSDQH